MAVAIPCLDEEATIGGVVRGFRRELPEARIVVFDNASRDATAEVALAAGAEVVRIDQRGKGNVMRAAFRQLVADGAEVILMVDGDGTYDPRAARRLVEAVRSGAELVYATRIGSGSGRYRPGHELGNRLLAVLHRLGFGVTPPDPLTGYRALSRSFASSFPARSCGFAIETEMNLFALAEGHNWCSVEAHYFARPEGSHSKLSTLRDGMGILSAAVGGTVRALDSDAPRAPGLQRPSLGGLLSAGIYTLLTLVVMTGIFLFANAWSTTADPTPLREALREALPRSEEPAPRSGGARAVNGEHRDDRYLPASVESFNDCLIPIMALERNGTPLQLTVSARRVYGRQRPQRICEALRQLLWEGRVRSEEYVSVFYHSYWNGQRVLLRAMAPLLGIRGLRATWRVATWTLIGLGALLALLLAVRGPPEARRLRLSVLAMLVAFALAGDLPRRAASFTSAPSNLLCLTLLLGFGLHARGLMALERRRRLILLAAFGAVLGYLALFFGTVLIGLVFVLLLVATTPLAVPLRTRDGGVSTSGPRARLLVESSLAVTLGIVGSLMTHALLAALVFEGAFAGVIDQLHHRMTGDPRSSMPAELNYRYGGDHVSWNNLLQRLDGRVQQLAFGNQWAGRLVAVGAVFFGVSISAWKLLGRDRSPHGGAIDRATWCTLLLAALAVPAWYALFREHTITHVGNMVRLLFLSLGVALTVAICWASDSLLKRTRIAE